MNFHDSMEVASKDAFGTFLDNLDDCYVSLQQKLRKRTHKRPIMADAREKRTQDAKSVTAKSSTKAEQEEKCCSRERHERGNWEGADGNTPIHGWLKKGGAAEEKAFQTLRCFTTMGQLFQQPNTKIYVNALPFANVWMHIKKEATWNSFFWLVKVVPHTVFTPARLRTPQRPDGD